MLYYYAQDLRQVTATRILPLPFRTVLRLVGRRATLPAGRAVNELRPRGRDWRKPGNMQNLACLMPFVVAGINDKSATTTTALTTTCAGDAFADGAKTDSVTAYDNKLIRSIIYYRALRMESECARGFFKGGYPFMFISPFDINYKNVCLTGCVSPDRYW